MKFSKYVIVNQTWLQTVHGELQVRHSKMDLLGCLTKMQLVEDEADPGVS